MHHRACQQAASTHGAFSNHLGRWIADKCITEAEGFAGGWASLGPRRSLLFWKCGIVLTVNRLLHEKEVSSRGKR